MRPEDCMTYPMERRSSAAGTDVTGQVWHLPVADAWTTRRIIARVYGLAGRKPRSFAAGRATLRILGLVNPAMKEYLHTLYQFTDEWIVDDRRFVDRFGITATPLDDALRSTVAWASEQAGADATASST